MKENLDFYSTSFGCNIYFWSHWHLMNYILWEVGISCVLENSHLSSSTQRYSFRLGVTNYGPILIATYVTYATYVNKVLLKHTHKHFLMYCLELCFTITTELGVAAKTIWPQRLTYWLPAFLQETFAYPCLKYGDSESKTIYEYYQQ